MLTRDDTTRLFQASDALLRVSSRIDLHQLLQGVVQGLIRHDLLACAAFDREAGVWRGEIYASLSLPPALHQAIVRPGTGMLALAWQMWMSGGCAVESFASERFPAPASPLRELGLAEALSHGAMRMFGRGVFFLFMRRGGSFDARDAALVEFLLPYLSSALHRAGIGPVAGGVPTPKVAADDTLTGRETEILHWLHQGKTNGQIAELLGISANTVKNHVQRVLRKLNVSNRVQAVARAGQHGREQ